MAAKTGFILKMIYIYVEMVCIYVLNVDSVKGNAAVILFLIMTG